MSTPTQVRFPLRAMLRTALAVILALGIVVPLAVEIILDEWAKAAPVPEGARAWMLGSSAAIVAVSSALTRVMAIPTVNAWLGRVGMSATPSTTPAVDPPAPLPPADPIVSSEGVTYPQSSDTKADAAYYDAKHDVD